MLWKRRSGRPTGRRVAGRTSAGMQAFRKNIGQLLDRFAVFSALQEQFGAIPWHQWPEQFADAGISRNCGFRGGTRASHRLPCLDAMDRGPAVGNCGRGFGCGNGARGLYLDLAVGVSANGADAWADSDTYVTGASIGAPPDAFNLAGQDWGTPPPNPLTLAGKCLRSIHSCSASEYAACAGLANRPRDGYSAVVLGAIRAVGSIGRLCPLSARRHAWHSRIGKPSQSLHGRR